MDREQATVGDTAINGRDREIEGLNMKQSESAKKLGFNRSTCAFSLSALWVVVPQLQPLSPAPDEI